jgi:hypothetical protein
MADEAKTKRGRTRKLDRYGWGVVAAAVHIFELHGDVVMSREILAMVGITDKKSACGRANREMASRLAEIWPKERRAKTAGQRVSHPATVPDWLKGGE